jgi:orotate phosphoribosyltransferase
MFLFHPRFRDLISDGFLNLLETKDLDFDVIAGTSTAGISPATTLADKLNKPFIYVRDAPKDHGLGNQIEGIDAESDLSGYNIVLVEDLISTGGSSVRAVEAIRNANGRCDYCVSIFDYGLDKAAQAFEALDPSCEVDSLLVYSNLLEEARDTNYINPAQERMLADWRDDPFN